MVDPRPPPEGGSGHGSRLRRGLAYLLVVAFGLLLPITFEITWTHGVVLDTDGWLRTVGPIATLPAVTEAVGGKVTSQIFTALDVQPRIASVLPPSATFLAGPISTGAKGYVQEGVTRAVGSQAFQTLWLDANRVAHRQLLAVLMGQSRVLTATDGQVVLNLVPVVNAALDNLGGFVSGLVGRPVTLPKISEAEPPAAACAKIGAALGRPVPPTCAQIPLFPADKLTQAQHFVRAFDTSRILLLVLTPLLAVSALLVSTRRRRTVMQLAVAGVLGLVIIRRATTWLQTSLVNGASPESKPARQAILTQVFHTFFSASRWIMVGLVIVFVVALVCGPYAWATSARRSAGRGLRAGGALALATVGHDAARGADDDVAGRAASWIRDHLDVLRFSGLGIAIVVLLAFSVSPIGLLVLAVLVVGYEVLLIRLAREPGPSRALR